jgi:ribonuclease T1
MIDMLTRRTFIVAMMLFLAWQWLLHREAAHAPAATASVTAAGTEAHDKAPEISSHATSPTASDASLPPEAQATLRLIASNGPFPYERDGVVFKNYEHRLPEHERGYYHEYTVPTPGAGDRGARRIIVGGDPPAAYYYSDDHYQTFRQIGASP